MRPIDADAAIAYIKTGYCTDCNSYNGVRCRACNFNDAMSAIEDAPTLDVEPVRHGRWEYKFYPTVWYGPGEPPEWICSVCQDRAYNTYDYCPNCGAKMDAKEECE